jgi:hypothetical protein
MIYIVYTQYELLCIHTVWITLYTHSMNHTVYTQYELHCIHTVWITLYAHIINYNVYTQYVLDADGLSYMFWQMFVDIWYISSC